MKKIISLILSKAIYMCLTCNQMNYIQLMYLNIHQYQDLLMLWMEHCILKVEIVYIDVM